MDQYMGYKEVTRVTSWKQHAKNLASGKVMENWWHTLDTIMHIKITNDLQWKLGITTEYTGKGMPQSNQLAELRFADIAGKARAMMIGDLNGISTDYKLEITVKMDSDYAKCLDTRRSMTGSVVHLNGAPVTFRSSTQKMVSLLITEAELNESYGCARCIVYEKRAEITWTEPILASIDNDRAVDIGNNWSLGSRMHHVGVK